jgi:hypothetical protein
MRNLRTEAGISIQTQQLLRATLRAARTTIEQQLAKVSELQAYRANSERILHTARESLDRSVAIQQWQEDTIEAGKRAHGGGPPRA